MTVEHGTDQPTPRHSPDACTARECHLCAFLRHPAQAKAGRALTKYLKTNPLPRQQVSA
ncbi:hypothetical protein ACFWFF_01475 [Streptomyces sp. NPDC060223]|uniref:hypothetical protein n=1 Tax=unclassified Streptomyces TaxID=2593676 RepID=UPI0036303EB7